EGRVSVGTHKAPLACGLHFSSQRGCQIVAAFARMRGLRSSLPAFLQMRLLANATTHPPPIQRPGQALRGSKYLNKGRPRQQGQGDGGRRLFLKFRRVHGILKAMKAPATTKADPPPLEIDEDKLAHALVARGLVTPEEIQTGRAARSKGNLLVRLVALG